MKCTRCGAPSTAADGYCGRCRLWLRMLEARARRNAAAPDFKMRAAGEA